MIQKIIQELRRIDQIRKPVLRLNDILHIQSKQINTLKNIIDKTNERWDDNDNLLKEVCERIDNIEQLGEMYNSLLDRVIMICHSYCMMM